MIKHKPVFRQTRTLIHADVVVGGLQASRWVLLKVPKLERAGEEMYHSEFNIQDQKYTGGKEILVCSKKSIQAV